jgi:hypothetical protein
MNGWFISRSVQPNARNSARWGARSSPRLTASLLIKISPPIVGLCPSNSAPHLLARNAHYNLCALRGYRLSHTKEPPGWEALCKRRYPCASASPPNHHWLLDNQEPQQSQANDDFSGDSYRFHVRCQFLSSICLDLTTMVSASRHTRRKPPGWEALACSAGVYLRPYPPNRHLLPKTEKLDR